MANSLFIKPMPAGFTFSAATKKLITARDNALKKFREYSLTNADYATVSTPQGPRIPAIVKAEAELIKLDREAVAAGKPLLDRGEYLAPHRAKAEEYKRTVAALRASYDQAFREAEDAIIDEMPTLARKALEECSKIHEEYVAAVEAAEKAQAKMHAATSRLVWAASDSHMDRSAGTGWEDFSDVKAFELTEDGRLTRRSAQALGLETYQNGSAVVYDELVDWEGTAPLHPRWNEVTESIGSRPEHELKSRTVYDVTGLSPEDFQRHFG